MDRNEGTFENLFDEMLKMGLVSSGNLWIEAAIEQRSTTLPITIASSRILTYDSIDRKIISLGKYN